jgi:hypothetical protein
MAIAAHAAETQWRATLFFCFTKALGHRSLYIEVSGANLEAEKAASAGSFAIRREVNAKNYAQEARATTKLYQHLNGLLWHPSHALSECVNHQFETIGNAEL